MTDESSDEESPQPGGAPHPVPRQGTGKMVALVIIVPVAVLLLIWALVRISAVPQVPESEVLDSDCETDDEVTVYRGFVDPESLESRDFDTATLRVEFFAFLVREESLQVVSPDDADPETGLIEISIVQEIEGPANCEIISFLPEYE